MKKKAVISVFLVTLGFSLLALQGCEDRAADTKLNKTTQEAQPLLELGGCTLSEKMGTRNIYKCPGFDQLVNSSSGDYAISSRYSGLDFPVVEYFQIYFYGDQVEKVRSDCLQACTAYRHIAYIDSGLYLINSTTQLESLVLPLESAEEARSYLLMKENLLTEAETEEILGEELDSDVTEKEGDYIVTVFVSEGGICCGTDYVYYAATYEITSDGLYSEISREKVGVVPNRAIA